MFACNKQQVIVPTNTDWNGTEFPISGGLLEITNPSLAYVVGNTGPYHIEYKVMQGSSNKTTKVDVYVTFYHFEHILGADGKDSLVITHKTNKKLLTTIKAKKTVTYFDTITFNYADLIKDLKYADNSTLPTADTSLTIGDYFEFNLVSTVADGKAYQSAVSPKVTVSGRYAGKWNVTEMEYRRIDEFRPDVSWKGVQISLVSKDATTYIYKDWGASIGFSGDLAFSVDPTTHIITYPAGNVLNGQPFITPKSNAVDFAPMIGYAAGLGYTTYNVAINDDTNGKDRIILMYGYYTSGSGPRTFFEVLDKVVE